MKRRHRVSFQPSSTTFLYRRECAVKTFSYTESRARYAEVLDLVVDDSEEVVITRAGMCQS